MHDLVVNLLLACTDVALGLALWRRKGPLWFALPLVAGLALVAFSTLGGMFSLMRAACWLLFVHAPLLFLFLAWVLRGRMRRLAVLSVAAAGVLVAVGVDAFLIEPRRLDVTHVSVVSAKAPRAMKIAVISDIQFEEMGDHERRALAAVMEEKPDLILFTGDYVQASHRSEQDAGVAAMNAELRALHFGAPLGAYAVVGNVDEDEWPAIFAGTGVKALGRSTRFATGGVSITALDLRDSFDTKRAVSAAPGFHIVFGHGPDFALAPVDADLLIAGHTHGGQVQLPFIGPLMTLSQVPRAWASGVTQLPGSPAGRTLVVSRGIGMERGRAPRLRFLCEPQVVMIDVRRPGPT